MPDGGLQSIARAGLVRSGRQLFHTAAGSCENLAEAKPTRAEHNGVPILPSISSPLIARSFACGQRESREVPTQASAGKRNLGGQTGLTLDLRISGSIRAAGPSVRE